MPRGLRKPSKLGLSDGAAGVGIGAGVQLDERRAESGGGVQLPGVGVNEDRHGAAGLCEARHGIPQPGRLSDDVKAALGGDLQAVLRDQAEGL